MNLLHPYRVKQKNGIPFAMVKCLEMEMWLIVTKGFG